MERVFHSAYKIYHLDRPEQTASLSLCRSKYERQKIVTSDNIKIMEYYLWDIYMSGMELIQAGATLWEEWNTSSRQKARRDQTMHDTRQHYQRSLSVLIRIYAPGHRPRLLQHVNNAWNKAKQSKKVQSRLFRRPTKRGKSRSRPAYLCSVHVVVL
jgi:hypothetical protein